MTRQRGNGEGSIYQREGRSGWYAAVTHAGRRKILRGDTRHDVARQLDAALVARERGQLVTAPSQTLEAYLSTWLEQVVKQSVRPRTYVSYEGVVRLHVVPTLGRTRLDRLAPAQVQELLNIKLAAGLSPRSVDYIRQVLKTALGKAVKWGLIVRNAAQLADGPRVESREVEPFTPDEARAFLSAVRGDRLEALYSVALAVGLRQGEALGLRWSDVDLEDGLIHVRQQLQRLSGSLQLVPLKTAKSRRTVALPASIVTKLREHRGRQLKERPAIGDGYVFATVDGAPLDAHNVLRAFKAVLSAAGLPDKRFHDLRHSCATLLLVQGTPIRIVMDLLGHSQISLTANTYSHVLPELRREAAARMEAILQG
jgi:integrase